MALPPTPLDAKTAQLRAARLARDAARPRRVVNDGRGKVLGLEDVMPFGKHQGKTIGDLIEAAPDYVEWLLENTRVELSPAAEAEYQAARDPRRPAWRGR